jgi:hypothetical protein
LLRLLFDPDDGGNIFLWNFSKLLPDYMVLHPKRQCSLHWICFHTLRLGFKLTLLLLGLRLIVYQCFVQTTTSNQD